MWVLNGDEWSASRPGRFMSARSLQYPIDRRIPRLQRRSDSAENIKICAPAKHQSQILWSPNPLCSKSLHLQYVNNTAVEAGRYTTTPIRSNNISLSRTVLATSGPYFRNVAFSIPNSPVPRNPNRVWSVALTQQRTFFARAIFYTTYIVFHNK